MQKSDTKRCTDQAGLRERVEDLLSDKVGFQRLSALDQAEALIVVAFGLLDGRDGPDGRGHTVRRGHELLDWYRPSRDLSSRPR